jgi:hypothetical protein
LLSRGKTAEAMALAKEEWRRTKTPGAESELVAAYVARIDELARSGMLREARDLAQLVLERHPAGRQVLEQRRRAMGLRLGEKKPWADLALAAEAGDAQAAETVRKELVDPTILTTCDLLPHISPLKKQAAAISKAFEAVTTRPAKDGETLLFEVPRRSPLADWKRLIRGIQYFYEGDDPACLRCLAAMADDSAPAAAAKLLEQMVAGRAEFGSVPAQALANRVLLARQRAGLDSATVDFKAALESHDEHRVSRAAKAAFSACARACPETLQAYQREGLLTALSTAMPLSSLLGSLATPLKSDYAFWRDAARASEICRLPAQALVCWEAALAQLAGSAPEKQALRTAIRRRMAQAARAAASPSASAATRKMARELLTPPVWRAVWPDGGEVGEEERSARAKGLFDPDVQFEKLCTLAPSDEHFRAWLDSVPDARAHSQERERVAGLWRTALPTHPAPLLLLAAEAESRDAYSTAIRHVEAARRLGASRDELDRALRRLTFRKAVRHIRQKNFRLAEQDCREFSEIPGSGEGGRPVIMAALKCEQCQAAGDKPGLAEAMGNLKSLVGGEAGAWLMLNLVHRAFNSAGAGALGLEWRSHKPSPEDAWRLLNLDCALASQFDLPFVLPVLWVEEVALQVRAAGAKSDPVLLQRICMAALSTMEAQLLGKISAGGLAAGRELPYFLACRALALRGTACVNRCLTCWRLALRLGDLHLQSFLHYILDRRNSWVPEVLLRAFDLEQLPGNEEEAREVAAREAEARWSGTRLPDFNDGPYAVPLRCICPVCTARRSGTVRIRPTGGPFLPGLEEEDQADDHLDDDQDEWEEDDYGDEDDDDYDDEEDDDYDEEEDDDYGDEDDDDYGDEDDDDEDPFDDDPLPAGVPSNLDDALRDLAHVLPPHLLKDVETLFRKVAGPGGKLPPPDEMMRIAPALYKRVSEGLVDLEASGYLSGGPGAGRRRKRRTRRRLLR